MGFHDYIIAYLLLISKNADVGITALTLLLLFAVISEQGANLLNFFLNFRLCYLVKSLGYCARSTKTSACIQTGITLIIVFSMVC